MPAIHHKVGVNASPEKVYEALTTNDGLSSWWTNDISGAGRVGSVIKFRFNGGGPDFEITELSTNATVKWKCVGGGPESWIGTEITFQILKDDDQTYIRFSHTNWSKVSDFMAHCSTKWAVFLLSLKDALDSGKGHPFPNDIQIDHS